MQRHDDNYGVPKNPPDWVIYCIVQKRKGKVIGRFYKEREKKQHLSSYYQVESRISSASCCCSLLFQNTMKHSISVHWNRKLHAPGGQQLYQLRNKNVFLSEDPPPHTHTHTTNTPTFFCCCDMWFDPSQFMTNNEYNTAPKMKNGNVCGDRRTEVSCVVIGWTVWRVSNSLSFSLHRHWRVLFRPRLRPLLCQLRRQLPVPLS